MKWKVVILVLAGVVVLFLIYAGLAFASLVGAFDSLRGDPPREGDPEVVAARQESAAALQQEASLVTQSAVLPGLPQGSALLAQGQVAPPCQEGQHNWKINDSYDLACSQSRREVVAVPEQSSFRADMVRLDESLRGAGWQPAFQPIPDVLTGYWDPLAGEAGMGGTPDHVYTMADLPSAGYTRIQGGKTRTLAVSWVERNSRGTDLTSYVSSSEYFVSGKQVAPGAVIDAVPAKGYAVVVSVSEDYFDK